MIFSGFTRLIAGMGTSVCCAHFKLKYDKVISCPLLNKLHSPLLTLSHSGNYSTTLTLGAWESYPVGPLLLFPFHFLFSFTDHDNNNNDDENCKPVAGQTSEE